MKEAQIQQYDRLLARMEQTVSSRLSGKIMQDTQDGLREVSSDEFDAAALSEALDVASMVGLNDAKTLEAVRNAREKIRTGVFGICEMSLENGGKGHVIAQERLKVIPHAENCIDCQTKAEVRQIKAKPLPPDWFTR